MISSLADPNLDKSLKKVITLALLGVKQTGKTSLANAFLGQNLDKNDAYNSNLDLFQAISNNNDDQKYGYLLGSEYLQKISVIDTKAFDP